MMRWLQIGAVGLLGALALLWGAHALGERSGRQASAVDALERSVNTLRDRNKVDDQISSADAAALCGDLGLSDADEDQCMRRLSEAPDETRDGRLHIAE